jgi:hypothetical protein
LEIGRGIVENSIEKLIIKKFTSKIYPNIIIIKFNSLEFIVINFKNINICKNFMFYQIHKN